MSKDYMHASKTGPGEMVLLRKGQEMPENAVSLLETEVHEIQLNRIEKFQPSTEMYSFRYGTHALTLVAAVSGYKINSHLRKAFNLGTLKIGIIGVPAVVIPAITGYIIHENWLKKRILVGREQCVSCAMVRSALVTTCIGVVYPYVISVVTCMPKAREHYTMPFPEGKGKGGFLRLMYRVAPPHTSILGLTLLNMVAGFLVSSMQSKCFYKHLLNPPSRTECEMVVDIGKR